MCPKADSLIESFGQPVERGLKAPLTSVGYAQMWEMGHYLRREYGGSSVLKKGGYVDDDSTFFYAERQNRNVQERDVFCQATLLKYNP